MAKAKKRSSGSWRVQLYVGADPVTGKRIYKSFTADTKKEAEYMAAQYQMGIEQEKKSSVTFRQAAEEYITLRSHVMAPRTAEEYRSMLNNGLSSLCHIRMDDLDQDAVQRFVNIFSIDHSPKTVRNHHGFIASVYSHYHPNAKLSTQLPGRVKYQITIPTDDQVLEAIRIATGHMPLIIQIGATLGMRRAEIAALTWADIQGNLVNINKAMTKTKEDGWFSKPPKTYAGTRKISAPPALISAILATRPDSAKDTDQIFPITPDYITKRWVAICKKLAFSCRFHDLRHYNASVMLSLGIPDKYAIRRTGHATTTMLRTVYQHIITSQAQAEDAKMDAYMSKFSEMQPEMQPKNQKAQ